MSDTPTAQITDYLGELPLRALGFCKSLSDRDRHLIRRLVQIDGNLVRPRDRREDRGLIGVPFYGFESWIGPLRRMRPERIVLDRDAGRLDRVCDIQRDNGQRERDGRDDGSSREHVDLRGGHNGIEIVVPGIER